MRFHLMTYQGRIGLPEDPNNSEQYQSKSSQYLNGISNVIGVGVCGIGGAVPQATMIDGSQILGFSLTSNKLQTGSVKEYGKKKIVKHLNHVSKIRDEMKASSDLPVVLLTD